MQDHSIRIQFRGMWETVQLTGRVSSGTVEVYRHNKLEWIPKTVVDPKQLHLIPKESAELSESQKVGLFVPEKITQLFVNERVKMLTNRVWGRLPVSERRLLLEKLKGITDASNNPSLLRYIYYTSSDDQNNGSQAVGCPAQMAENLPHKVDLSDVVEIESDSAAMFVIAREFAKDVLRYPELFAIYGAYRDSTPDFIYSEFLRSQLQLVDDHATLIAWSWGFKEEYKAYVEANPNKTRKEWFAE